MIDLDNAARVLNEFLDRDPIACQEFFTHETTVNVDIVNHPTIQVGYAFEKPTEGPLRALGLINGLVGRGKFETIAEEPHRVLVMRTNDAGTEILSFTVGTLQDGKVSVPDEPKLPLDTDQ